MVKVASVAQYRSVAAVIEACRYETGLTQTQLAQRMGATQKFVSLIETGARRVDVLELFAIERALGLKPLALVERIYEADKAVDDDNDD
ncbi:helix-turn-helix domain-containing protein [Novosphingobium sp. UBA1939]|uniref:helix-turn-helix domain-containing protein n=1 Tax=Novosphingobium sp. UBA1939 TaxID=1946982 RepID=UPI0025F8EE3C|nr:helix-turn-helix transcriptional regulator [Novosphingobium sp. UBA1939]